MTVYKITYETKTIRLGTKLPWKEAESTILTSDETIDAIEELKKQLDPFGYCDFRVTSLTPLCQVNIIARSKNCGLADG